MRGQLDAVERCAHGRRTQRLHLENFGAENQQTFIGRIAERGVSRKTVVNVLATLSSVLSTARNWGYNCQEIDLDKLKLPLRGSAVRGTAFHR